MPAAAAGQVLWGLVPFFTTVFIYFLLLIPSDTPSIESVIVKCMPIISLMYFITKLLTPKDTYSIKILLGLFWSCLGDGFLVWNQCFIVGMVCFMLAHLCYLWAYGMKPLKLKIAGAIFLLGLIDYIYICRRLNGVLLIGVPIYILVISFMVWRAIARIQINWTWLQISACVGSILFATSDFLIGLDMFVKPFAHSQVLIMSSYYAAQLGITLSVLDKNT